MTYQLSISISPQDLNAIKQNGQRVVVSQQIASQGSGLPVAWSAFEPLTSNNFAWENSYQAYASKNQLVPGVLIYPSSQAGLSFGESIPYKQSGFGKPEGGPYVPSNAMVISNQDSSSTQISAGLSQQYYINGRQTSAGPACASSIMKNMNSTFTPQANIQVFLASNINSGTVLSSIPSNACSLSFADGEYSQSIRYDASSGRFVNA
jgi:hypothetical protein